MSQNIWMSGFYTSEQIGLLSALHTKLSTTGEASAASRLEVAMANEVPFEDLDVKQSPVKGTEDIRPEVGVNLDEIGDMPPRTGPEATTEAWRHFAAAVTDIEEEVLDNLGRGDIIDLLIDKGIINEED